MRRALVVDDEVVSRIVLSHMLRDRGWDVAEAPDAATAVALSAGGNFDVVFSDFLMPGGTGLDLLGALKRSGSVARFVLVTGMVEHLDADPNGAADARLTKPISSRSLTGCLGSILGDTS